MNILFISKYGNSLSLAQRVKEEGHTTYLYTHSEVGEGIVNKTNTHYPLTTGTGRAIKGSIATLLKETTPGLVVFDSVGMGDVADYIHTLHIPTLGSNKWGDVCTTDEGYGKRVMRMCGISCNERDGVQVECGMWWNGLTSHLHTLSIMDSRFMEGGIGKDVESAGTTTLFIQPGRRLVMESISKVERVLKRVNYRGPLTLHCVVGEKGVSGLGWRVGFAYDIMQTTFELYKGSTCELLYNVANSNGVSGKCYVGYSVGVRVSIPPYPHGEEGITGIPLLGVSEKNSKHIWLRDAQQGELGYVSAGGDGNILTVTARGKDVRECRRRAYRTISNLHIVDMQYRRDVGEKVEGDLLTLRKWGYL